jgi:hypothetical protein
MPNGIDQIEQVSGTGDVWLRGVADVQQETIHNLARSDWADW